MTAPLLSLCVGVTGHRDIAPDRVTEVTKLVEQAFDRLEALGCPITVLSALAEGADRLVAKIAIDRKHALVVPLPMPEADYIDDFKTEESKAEFKRLLGLAERHYVVEQLKIQKERDKSPRDAAYRSVGVAIAHACHVLLALWDGIDNHKSGGTSDIVRTKRQGEHTTGMGRRGFDVRKPNGAVIHLVTPRVSNETPPIPALRWPSARIDEKKLARLDEQEQEGERERAEAWRRTLSMARRIRQFNKDANRIRHTSPAKVEQSRNYLHGDSPPEPPNLDGLSRIVDLYAVADALAIRGQSWVRMGWRLLMLSGVFGVVFYGLYAHSQPHPGVLEPKWFGYPRVVSWLAIYVCILTIAGVAYVVMTWQRTQPRFLDYRALAEGLRVAYFWRVAGLPGEPADWYPSHLSREVYWLSMALRSEAIRLPPPAVTNEGLNFAIAHWVKGQRKYFVSANKRNHTFAVRFKNSANVLLVLGLAMPMFVLGLALARSPWLEPGHEHLREMLVLAIAFLPALAGAFAAYTDRLGHETQSHQYRRMLDLFALAIKEIDAHRSNPDAQRRTLVRLAGDALGEHAQWVVLHRQRPFELRAGG